MDCIIMGFYWEERIERAIFHKFVGHISVDDSGEFEGTIEDDWGDASITGEIKRDKIFFRKEYTKASKNKGATKNLLVYSFVPRAVNNVVVGWKGSWVDKKEEFRGGGASCLIFPHR